MACYINIENRYRCASLRERQMHHVWAATAAAVITVGTTAVSAGMQASAASKAAKAKGAAGKKLAKSERAAMASQEQALKKYRKEQKALTGEVEGIKAPVMDIGADIREAERITGYNLAQLEQIYPGAASQRQLASLAINDMIQGKLPQADIGETMREAAQRGGAGFNIATAGKGAIAQAPQYDYARAIGASRYGVMQQGRDQLARWQEAALPFIQGTTQITSQRYQYGMGGAELGLKKVGIKGDMLTNFYNAQLGLSQGQQQMGQRQYERQQEQIATNLALDQQRAEMIQKIGESVSSGASAAGGAYSKYAAAKGGGGGFPGGFDYTKAYGSATYGGASPGFGNFDYGSGTGA